LHIRRLLPARDLVMGFATGYRIETIAPFVESLVSDGAFVGEAVLFIQPNDLELKAYLKERGIRTPLFQAAAYPFADVMLARWFAYRDYLQRRIAKGKRYRNILITDVRDVIFQKPVFSAPCEALEFQFEAPEPRIGACPINSNWVRKWFGEAALAALAEKRITCAGTVTGRQDVILKYIDAMTRLIAALPDDGLSTPGGDQGVHNWIAHNAMIEEAVFLDNYRRVATLHYVDGASLRADARGRVVNPDGAVSELAHQWDRHPHLVAAIEAQANRRRLATSDPMRRRLLLLGNRIKGLVKPVTEVERRFLRKLRRMLPPSRRRFDAAVTSCQIAQESAKAALETAKAEIASLRSRLQEEASDHRERVDRLEQRLHEYNQSLEQRLSEHNQCVEQRLSEHNQGVEQRLSEQANNLEAAVSASRSRDFVLEQLLTASTAARPPGASKAVARIGAPAVSVILPTYNRAGFVGEAIESVRAQVFTEWELIVVDDGSDDNTQDLVASFLSDHRISYVRQEKSGSSTARNRGLDATKAPLVAYIDSDNLWYPDFLYCAVDYLATHPDIDLVYGALVTDLHGLDGSNVLWRPFDRTALVAANFIDTNVIVHRRELLAKYENWDPRLSRVNDWDLVLRFTVDKPAYPLPVLAAYYRSCDKIRVTDIAPVEDEFSIVREKLKMEICETN
jgi:hypothetical protein